jgi:hypothetical protein
MRPQLRRWLIIILMWAAFGVLAYQAYQRGSRGLSFYVGAGIITLALLGLTRAIVRIPGRKR